MNRTRGFSLIELSVVLAVLSVLAAMVVPNVIALTRNRLAQRLVLDMQAIGHAARLFYVDQAGPDLSGGRWPGANTECKPVGVPGMSELIATGYLPAPLKDPFTRQGNYILRTYKTTTTSNSCLFQLTTATGVVPPEVETMVGNALPNGSCTGEGTCTVRFAQPGFGASALEAYEEVRVAPTVHYQTAVSGAPTGSYCTATVLWSARHLLADGNEFEPATLVPNTYVHGHPGHHPWCGQRHDTGDREWMNFCMPCPFDTTGGRNCGLCGE